MPLVLKLIGQFQGRKTYEIRDSFNGPINLDMIMKLLVFQGLDKSYFDKIKFITDSEQIKNPEKVFQVKESEERIIFVFTSDSEVREKLAELFVREGQEVTKAESTTASASASASTSAPMLTQPEPDPEITKPLTSKEPDVIPKLTDDIISIMNAKSMVLFSDSDFRSLISIYLRRPELFATLANYVQNGNVVEESLEAPKTISDLSEETISHYNILVDKILQLNIKATPEVIMDKLIKYSGHLNLTVRSLLCDSLI